MRQGCGPLKDQASDLDLNLNDAFLSSCGVLWDHSADQSSLGANRSEDRRHLKRGWSSSGDVLLAEQAPTKTKLLEPWPLNEE